MYKKYLKRFIDVLICVMSLPIYILLFIIFGFLIKHEDKGPILYKGERIGKDGKIFKMLKFRSMNVNSEILLSEDGTAYNLKDDLRVSKIGKYMRENSIDEIPQIINVLKGEMSIIGPRASLPWDLSTFKADEVDKMKVRPGITGYTQAYYRNSIPSREKRIMDAWYANNISFLLDMKIFFRTIRTVVMHEGIYPSENIKVKNKQ